MVIHLCQRRSSRSRWRCCADANAGAVRCRCACAAAAKTTAAADAAAAAGWAQQFNAASSSASSTATACASATANAVARIAAGSEVNSTARKHRDARRIRLCSQVGESMSCLKLALSIRRFVLSTLAALNSSLH